jgi:hypothetical protein
MTPEDGSCRRAAQFVELLGRQKTQLERGVPEAEILALSEERKRRGLLVADIARSRYAD